MHWRQAMPAHDNEREYIGAHSLSGPILVLDAAQGISSGESVELRDPSGAIRRGSVLRITEKYTFVQVFGGTKGLSPVSASMKFLGHPFTIPAGKSMLGRIMNGLGEPIDNAGPIIEKTRLNINGLPINPCARAYPKEFIQTGISAIDGMNSIVRGQKIGIFSGAGLPHNALAAQILSQSQLTGSDAGFCVILAGMGLTRDDADFFIQSFRTGGQSLRATLFLNLADDPPEEMILTPRIALTLAEELAFTHSMHVLVILTDITNYCEALREISSFREEVPSRKGYPGYMYTDLASLYERTGRIKGKTGSITQIPILSMPNMDITHPIPDLTGYITEGQIVLSPDLMQAGIYPPINVLPSLSRLMKDGIGEGLTREDHPNLSSQLYYSYSEAVKARSLASIIGREDLTPRDKSFLVFGDRFEDEFVRQTFDENRTIQDTLDQGWAILKEIPRNELHRVSKKQTEQYLPETDHAEKS
jgi:V/A-type H+/Na+-transporting ATPase subunit B